MREGSLSQEELKEVRKLLVARERQRWLISSIGIWVKWAMAAIGGAFFFAEAYARIVTWFTLR